RPALIGEVQVTESRHASSWVWWAAGFVLVAGLGAGTCCYLLRGMVPAEAQAAPEAAATPTSAPGVRVETIHPRLGTVERTSAGQPGSVQAFESVQLYAE